MSDYTDYKLTLELRSALGTPMQSDTLFGHLCWQVRFEEGDTGVRRFLAPFLAGEPLFVFSDAFPEGLLPRPLLPMAPAPAASTAEYATMKRWNKGAFIRESDFLALVRGENVRPEPVADLWEEHETPHAAIDRLSWTTSGEGGQFYQTYAQALRAGAVRGPDRSRPLSPASRALQEETGQRLQIFVRCRPDAAAQFEDLVRRVSRVGFGRDKSVGAGQFEVVDFQEYAGLAGLKSPDGFVSLSTCSPAAEDPTDGFWRVRVKRGFLGESYAPDSDGDNPNPFKRPLIQIEPGAVFRVTTDSPVQSFYGRMVREIAPGFRAAVQCGLTLTVPCRWPSPRG